MDTIPRPILSTGEVAVLNVEAKRGGGAKITVIAITLGVLSTWTYLESSTTRVQKKRATGRVNSVPRIKTVWLAGLLLPASRAI